MKRTKRTFSNGFKSKVAIEAIKGIKTISEIASEYDVHPVQVNTWKKTFLERSETLFDKSSKADRELSELKEERDELYRQIGELKVENTWFKKKLK